MIEYQFMEYAVIETGGKQYKVSEGDVVLIDRLSTTDKISFDHVLLHVTTSDTKIGKPYLTDVVVTGKVLGEVLGDKVHIRRFTAKSRHRRHIGFRAALSKVQIESIGKGTSTTQTVKAAAKTTTKKPTKTTSATK